MANDPLHTLTTREKARRMNMTPSIYGTFAEIGAGQEVADNFFRAGRASGTVVKTISAYDMTFSDSIYGPCQRYVCEERLDKMLHKEYQLLEERLDFRAGRSTFFVFANTIRTKEREEGTDGHGWIGVRFQLRPYGPCNRCVIHVTLKQGRSSAQQSMLGVVGVNLLYACYYYTDPDEFILSLKDNLDRHLLYIDLFSLQGEDFSHIDNRLMSLKLVKNRLAKATMFTPKGAVIHPSEVLYDKNVVVLRGRFRPVTWVIVDMMISGLKQFKREEGIANPSDLISLSEITLRDLEHNGEVDEVDFMDRVDILCSLGQTVLISNYHEYYRLSEYLTAFTNGKRVGIILGYGNLKKVYDARYYSDLPGGILEALGRLFSRGVRLYVYPSLEDNTLKTSEDVTLSAANRHLFAYAVDRNKIVDVENVNKENLHIVSDDVLRMIQSSKKGWEKYVPNRVANAIRHNHLFNHPASASVQAKE